MPNYAAWRCFSCLGLGLLLALPAAAGPGTVRIQAQEDGRLVVTGNDLHLVYDPHGCPTRNATLTSESRIHGQSLLDAHAVWGGPHLRWVGYLEGYGVHSQLPWRARVVQTEGSAAGFVTRVATTHFWDAAVTHVFFWDLPEVILFDVELIKRRDGPGSEMDGVAMCAFSTDRYLYNGMRLYNDDAGPYQVSFGHGPAGTLTGSDPVNGIFLKQRGGSRYVTPHLTRNLVLAQRDGENGPASPPCGWIFGGRFGSAVTTDDGGYYAHMVVVHPEGEPLHAGQSAHLQVLWFQGGAGNLERLEQVFALEESFRRPLVVETAHEHGRNVVYARETVGLARPWQIVILAPQYRALATRYPLFRGPGITALLLRDVRPGSRRLVGYLPADKGGA